MRFESKVAIVTGASSGIGYAASRLLAREGAALVLCARDEKKLSAIAEEINADFGDVATFVAGDVTLEDTHERIVREAERKFGGVDACFNNVGSVTAMGTVEDLSLEQWNVEVSTNLTSAFLAAKYQIPAIERRSGGAILFTSSFVGNTVGFPGIAAYAAAKAGVVGLTKALAVDLASRSIRVNALLPGGTDTPTNFANVPGAPPETRAFIEGLHAMKRLGRPEEIAEAALFLLSEQSSFITGAALLADGGVSITRT